MTRLDLFKQILLTPESIKDMGKGLPLFIFAALNSGKDNTLRTSYEEIRMKLGAPQSTAKQWRDCLVANKVLAATSGKGSMLLKLIAPYDAIATCDIDDISEVRRIGDPSMRRAMKNMDTIDMVTVIASIGKIADKVGRLEQMIENKS